MRDEPTVVCELIISEAGGQLPRGDVFYTCERGPSLVDCPRPRQLAIMNRRWEVRRDTLRNEAQELFTDSRPSPVWRIVEAQRLA